MKSSVIIIEWTRMESSSNGRDRKSTRLNSSHLVISYAVFCLKKKKQQHVPLSAPLLAPPSPLHLFVLRLRLVADCGHLRPHLVLWVGMVLIVHCLQIPTRLAY